MFEFLSLIARQPFQPRFPDRKDFRRLETVRGRYFVDWEPDSVNALLAAEDLSAEDLRETSPGELHRLIRDLLLLGLRDELESCRRSPITRFARSLMRYKRATEDGADGRVSAA